MEFHRLHRKLDLIRGLLHQLNAKDDLIMTAMTDLQAAVAQETTVEGSVLTLLQGIADQLKAAGTDPAALAALTSQINTNISTMQAAVTANTPAAP